MNLDSIILKADRVKDILNTALGDNSAISGSKDFQPVIKELEKLKEKLKKADLFLVVVGLFKRGKSTLINALVQKEVLPTSNIPLTSVITFLEYSEKNYLEVTYSDNTTAVYELKDIPEFVTEDYNPGNEKKVEMVKVYLNSEFLKNFTLVDTPGIGSTFEHISDITYKFIEKIDAALYLLSADIPITAAETEFLDRLKSSVPKIIYVFNKIDLSGEREISRLMDFNTKVLKSKYIQDEIKMLPVSSRWFIEAEQTGNKQLAEKSGIYNLVNEIRSIDTKEKYHILKESAENQLGSIIDFSESMIDLKIRILSEPVEKLNALQNEFAATLKIMEKDKADFEILIEGKIKQLKNFVTDSLAEIADDCKNQLFREAEKNIHSITSLYNKEGFESIVMPFREKIEECFEPKKIKLENEVIKKFRDILRDYAEGSNRFLNELSKISLKGISANLEELAGSFDLKINSSFYFHFEDTVTPLFLKLKIFRKPASLIFRKKTVSFIKAVINEYIERNFGRINYDINYKIQESFRKFSFNLNENNRAIINTLNGMISETIYQKQFRENSIQAERDSLSFKLSEIRSLRLIQ